MARTSPKLIREECNAFLVNSKINLNQLSEAEQSKVPTVLKAPSALSIKLKSVTIFAYHSASEAY